MARKKKFMVVPRTPQAREQGITTTKGKREFNRGAFFVSDPGEAEEIDSRYGLKGKKPDVWVHEDPVYEWSLHHDMSVKGHNIVTHNYTFGNMWTEDAWARYQKKKKARERAEQRKKREKAASATGKRGGKQS